MVGMCGRVISFDNIPVSERLYFYFLFHRKKYKHLYYCKNCVLNFETQKPAEKCTRCSHTEIIELHPKDFLKSDFQIKMPKIRYKTPAMPKIRYDVRGRLPKTDIAERTKVWFQHFASPKGKEELPTE